MKATLQWRLFRQGISSPAGTRTLVALAAGAALALPAFAQSDTDYCAKARDPARCEARQAALKACADKRGKEKQACLDAGMSPVDCSRAQNPERCEAAEKARQGCKGKTGKALKKCLRDEQPPKRKTATKPRTGS